MMDLVRVWMAEARGCGRAGSDEPDETRPGESRTQKSPAWPGSGGQARLQAR